MKNKSLFQAPEGIDTITLCFKHEVVNSENWLKNQKYLSRYISTRKRWTGYKTLYYFDIQAEYLDLNQNILYQILNAIYFELYRNSMLNYSIFFNDYTASYLIFYNYQEFVTLHAVDFNFDCPENVLRINPNAIKQYTTSVYSKQFRDGFSRAIVYDRRPNLRKQNQIKYSEIDTMPRPMRFEIRLRKSNSPFMNLLNLNGNYFEIMSYIWRTHLSHFVGIHLPELSVFTNELQFTNPMLYALWLQYLRNPCIQNSKNLLKTPKADKQKNQFKPFAFPQFCYFQGFQCPTFY